MISANSVAFLYSSSTNANVATLFPIIKNPPSKKFRRNFGWAERDAIFGAHSRSCLAVNARRAE